MPKLIMLSAPSASGKTTKAWELMESDGNLVRLNKDDLRKMSITKWRPSREDWIVKSEIALCKVAAACRKNILIDDTNLMPTDEDRWKNVAKEIGYTFKKVKLDVSLEECVRRDAGREASIGRPAIERQFLKAGLWKVPVCAYCLGYKQVSSGDKLLPCEQCHTTGIRKTAIFDVDGTLACLQQRIPWITIGATCPKCKGEGKFQSGVDEDKSDFKNNIVVFHEQSCSWCEGTGKIVKKNHDMFHSLCDLDTPIDIVVRWIRECYKYYHVLIVSGRAPEKGGEKTIEWLKRHDIPYHHILMRRSGIHGPDHEEKQLILDMILKVIPKEDIAFVTDDRPSVLAMWKKNGLKVFPVRGRDDDQFYTTGDPETDLGETCVSSSTT